MTGWRSSFAAANLCAGMPAKRAELKAKMAELKAMRSNLKKVNMTGSVLWKTGSDTSSLGRQWIKARTPVATLPAAGQSQGG